MDIPTKLRILADAAKYDASCASSGSRAKGNGRGVGSRTSIGICHSYAPDGRCISLLKLLLTNYCVYDCTYCVNRISSDVQRARFSVDEIVDLTLSFYKRNYIEGLFLSSGVLRSPDATMELLAEVARRLREDHHFGGYIHLKAVPGASDDVLAVAGQYADRLSANVELPTQAGLDALAPAKRMRDVEDTMGVIATRREEAVSERRKSKKAPRFAPAGQSTQMIVGATPASDKTILTSASTLYDRYRLRRVYYSAFSPIPSADPRLPLAAPPLQREHRLYQADWLLRQYGFELGELFAGGPEDLPLDIDPKLAWALRHRHLFPVDLNRAPRELLLRVPGLGTRNVGRLLKLRRRRRVVWDDLVRLRAVTKRAAHFVDVPGVPKTLGEPESAAIKTSVTGAMQLDLFAAPQPDPGSGRTSALAMPPAAVGPSQVAAVGNAQMAAAEALTGEL